MVRHRRPALAAHGAGAHGRARGRAFSCSYAVGCCRRVRREGSRLHRRAVPVASPRYFLGGFTEYGFVAQVVAQLFVVAMWWAAAAWDAAPDVRLGCVRPARCRGLPVVAGLHRSTCARILSCGCVAQRPSLAARARHLVAGSRRSRDVRAIYLVGRLGWLQLAGTGGRPRGHPCRAYGWPLVALVGRGARRRNSAAGADAPLR